MRYTKNTEFAYNLSMNIVSRDKIFKYKYLVYECTLYKEY